jgi:hypothetical protein
MRLAISFLLLLVCGVMTLAEGIAQSPSDNTSLPTEGITGVHAPVSGGSTSTEGASSSAAISGEGIPKHGKGGRGGNLLTGGKKGGVSAASSSSMAMGASSRNFPGQNVSGQGVQKSQGNNGVGKSRHPGDFGTKDSAARLSEATSAGSTAAPVPAKGASGTGKKRLESQDSKESAMPSQMKLEGEAKVQAASKEGMARPNSAVPVKLSPPSFAKTPVAGKVFQSSAGVVSGNKMHPTGTLGGLMPSTVKNSTSSISGNSVKKLNRYTNPVP